MAQNAGGRDSPQYRDHFCGQIRQRGIFHFRRDTVKRFGNTACHGRNGITVATGRDGKTNGMGKVFAFEKGNYRQRYGGSTSGSSFVVLTEMVAGVI